MNSFPSNAHYQTNYIEVENNTLFNLELEDGYGVILPLTGGCTVENNTNEKIELSKGQPAMLPAAAGKLVFNCTEKFIFALILPDQCELNILSLIHI